ncbi:Gag-Pol polyprotein [Labeo rohita]|uniref:Gag-Pol polyprotein n=1 Tax=Labeo rohita TaxID=84645 RepID=A0ABQ8L4S7_LABRO|nr:Gag-Pol polyprotein [Labeo rohita]
MILLLPGLYVLTGQLLAFLLTLIYGYVQFSWTVLLGSTQLQLYAPTKSIIVNKRETSPQATNQLDDEKMINNQSRSESERTIRAAQSRKRGSKIFPCHLNGRDICKVVSLSQAAVLADEFVLTHKTVFVPARSEKIASVQSAQSQPPCVKPVSPRPKEVRECFYCHKRGHVIVDCLALKRKQQPPPKSVGFVNSVSDVTSALLGEDCADPSYKPFLMKGLISLSGKPEDQREIQLLRDTGAAYSFVVANALPLSEQSFCGSSILVQGIEMGFVKVPLHRIHLQCELVTGFVSVGVRPSLPIKGVSFILGNDLAGGKVTPALEVVDHPSPVLCPDELSVSFPDAFPACARSVTENGRSR